MLEEPLLSVRDLSLAFHTEEGKTTALRGVSLDVMPGRVLGVVGESGSGKSVTSLSVMRLLPTPPAEIESGEIRFGGRDLLRLRESEMRSLRGREIAMIFQEPMSSLNPVHRVGDQIAEAIRAHEGGARKQARERAVDLLRKVGIPDPAERARAYPHELSGGMRQRVMIAIALACGPKLLIADEPTTALDVTIQAQILDLLRSLREEMGMSIVLITHDLGVVADLADEIAVMYAGRVVEHAPVRELFERPRHPYTRGLLESLPSYHDNLSRARLPTIPGVVPDLRELPEGCAFEPRCPWAERVCKDEDPPETVRGAVRFRCHVVAREEAE
jgi:peptide/nickel transport system ATP-binding protein